MKGSENPFVDHEVLKNFVNHLKKHILKYYILNDLVDYTALNMSRI